MTRFHVTVDGPVPFTPEEEAEWDAMAANAAANRLAAAASDVRAERNRRLAACDWTQLPDCTADTAAWATYRQALRDVPSQQGFPDDVTWPTEP